MVSDDEAIRNWLVETGRVAPEDKNSIRLHVCRTGDAGVVASSSQNPPVVEGRNMGDMVNKVEVAGTVKWEPKVFEPKEDGQKVITVFAIEWIRPKSDNKKSVFHIKTFGDVAEKLRDENLAEGDVVTVTGSLNESKWKDKKTDEWVNRVEVWATKVEIDERAEGVDTSDFKPVDGAAAEDDDIPF